MKVIVTGGAGFIGSHVVDLLVEDGFDVIVIDNLVSGSTENINKKAKFYQIDITNNEIINIFNKEKPDFLIHQAAQINVKNSIENPIYDANVNINGSINLLEACVKSGVKKVIYPSSAAIFGNPEYLPIDEKHPLNMISPYGITKHTVEHYLDVYKNIYGLNYIALRCANVYGSRQNSSGEGGVIAIYSKMFTENKNPVVYGDGNQTRDFVYVEDVARANIMALLSDKTGIYNVCTNNKLSINELIKRFNVVFKKELTPIYEDPRNGDILHSYMTYEKINTDLGWKPEYSIDEGIKKMHF